MEGKIIFIDDDPEILSSLQKHILHQPQWQCHFFQDAEAALSHLADNDCDIVVSDIMMERMDGLALLDILKSHERFSHIEVIMVTGWEKRRMKQLALARGAMDLLAKPVSIDELTARLNSVLRLISYRRQLEEKNRALEEQLAGAQKMELVGTLAAGAIHDLKNLLVVIGGLGNRMQLCDADARAVAEDKFYRHKEMLLQTVSKAETLARKILCFSRQEKEPLSPHEISGLVAENVEIFRSLLPKTVSLELELPAQEYRARLNRQYLAQILMNLIFNAAEAMHNNGMIRVCVGAATEDEPQRLNRQEGRKPYLRISVQDSGPGISPQDLPQIFTPCFTTKAKSGGTGLGLFVSKWLVEQMQGLITVTTAPDSGCCFEVLFPAIA
ncbi:MAG: hypothetical protein BWK76_11415 [Desulfobulbaceae bacterium A2]|nr:MAG: hypothetical protein BWK76_11415 [Desulfobulbaceae bacterium A2]